MLRFWFRELRTPAYLIELAAERPEMALQVTPDRPLLKDAMAGDEAGLAEGLAAEAAKETERNRVHWEPLRRERERLRHAR